MYNRDEAPPFLREFLDYFATIKGRSKNTVNSYYHDIKFFLRFLKAKNGLVSKEALCAHELFEQINVSDFPEELIRKTELMDILEFLHYLARERGNTQRARHRRGVAIRQLFKYLTNNKLWFELSPAQNLELPKPKFNLPKSLSLEQAIELLRTCEAAFTDSSNGNNAEIHSRDWLAVRNYCIMTFFLNSGMRLSELVGLNTTDFRRELCPDTGENIFFINVIGKGSKERVIYLNAACIKAHDLYAHKRRELCAKHPQLKNEKALFISKKLGRISARQVEQIITNRLRESGLDGLGFSVHKLRHTAATLMYRNGVDVRVLKEILGHESLETTQIYTHVANEQMRQAMNNNPLAGIDKI
ncbi:MAG: tyrosine-type recombinase/integrase [Oscillospiraceae bacterium]|nr:tyrosine-type recombinase/integrase [Oscillospiraceae bacterium]